MRRQFGKTIVELAEKDDRIVLLYGDVFQNMEAFQEKFPDRIFNCGIAEQSMVSMAAGMALGGLKPFVYSLTPFLLERAFEQWKMDIDVMKANVVGIGYSQYETHGPSQSPLIDPCYLINMLNHTVYYGPDSAEDTDKCLRWAAEDTGPVFISLHRDGSRQVTLRTFEDKKAALLK